MAVASSKCLDARSHWQGISTPLSMIHTDHMSMTSTGHFMVLAEFVIKEFYLG